MRRLTIGEEAVAADGDGTEPPSLGRFGNCNVAVWNLQVTLQLSCMYQCCNDSTTIKFESTFTSLHIPILVQAKYLTPTYIEQPLSPTSPSPNHQKGRSVRLIPCAHDDAPEQSRGDYEPCLCGEQPPVYGSRVDDPIRAIWPHSRAHELPCCVPDVRRCATELPGRTK
jgi:hypothetical protein